jgi:hypothetical protein
MGIQINAFTSDEGIVITASTDDDHDRTLLSWTDIAAGLRDHLTKTEAARTDTEGREG